MSRVRYFILAVFLLSAVLTGCGNKDGKMQSIEVKPKQRMIATGSRDQFESLAVFADGTIVNWTSATDWSATLETGETVTNLVRISNSFNTYGLVESISYAPTGTILITGKDVTNNVLSRATLSVVDPLALFISPYQPYMKKGMTHDFRAEALLTTDPTVTLQNLTTHATWTTDDETIAKVSKLGVVTIRSLGTTTLYSTYTFSIQEDPVTHETETTRTAETAITVWDKTMKSISISADSDPTAITRLTVPVGTDTVQFYATALFTDSTSTTSIDFTQSVNWRSSNEKIATIGNHPDNSDQRKGLCTLKPNKTGKTTIRASDPINGIYKELYLTVEQPPI